jgi:glycosyltransferase involved in cell wall biosynthesis
VQFIGRFREWVRRTPWARAILAPPWVAVLIVRQRGQELAQWARNADLCARARARPRLRVARALLHNGLFSTAQRLQGAARRYRYQRGVFRPPSLKRDVRLRVDAARERVSVAQQQAPLATGRLKDRARARAAAALRLACRAAYSLYERSIRLGGRGRNAILRSGQQAVDRSTALAVGVEKLPSRLRTNTLKLALRNEKHALDWAFARRSGHGPVRRVLGRLALRGADAYYRHEFQKIISADTPVLAHTEFDPQHIVLVIGSLGPGGAERQVMTTLLGLQKTGAQRLSLICTFLQEPWQRFFLEQLEQAGIEVRELAKGMTGAPQGLDSPARERFQRAFGSLPPLLGDIRDYAAEFVCHKPGIVHLWLDEINCKAGLAALAVGVPRIVMSARSVAPHHFGLYHQYMAEAYRLLLRRPSVTLLNNSGAGAIDYARWLGLRRGGVQVVRNGFRLDEFCEGPKREVNRRRFREELGWDSAATVVGTILRFTEEKRPDLWIEAALSLAERRPDMRFLLVGDGPMRAAVAQRADALGMASRFAFTGHLRDTIAALCAMDVFMLTSRKEGLPNVLVEAQALGVPVVSTDAGGARETFLPGESGLLVADATAEALAVAVLAIVDDPARCRAWSVRARDQVRERFGIERMVWETRAAYGLAANPAPIRDADYAVIER